MAGLVKYNIKNIPIIILEIIIGMFLSIFLIFCLWFLFETTKREEEREAK